MPAWQPSVAATFWPVVVPKAANASVSRCNWQPLRQRADFLRLQQTGRKWVTPAFVVRCVRTDSQDLPQFGLTVTKKIGNAVIRNRIRRRLRPVLDRMVEQTPLNGWQIVLIARAEAATLDADKLLRDLHWAIKRLLENRDAA